MSVIEAAASLLAQARTGPALSGLPEALRPGSLDQAEAIQNATMQALGDRVGGWKVGRHAGQIFSAPIPASRVMTDPGDGAIAMPSARFIELELGIRFRGAVLPADVAALVPGDLIALASVAIVYELVQTRFLGSAETGPLDRIADCVANYGALAWATPMPWTPDSLDHSPAVTLWQDDTVIARRAAGSHVAAPVRELIEAWIARLRRDGRGIAPGEIVTFGSLTGMPPVPAAGASYLGEIEGLEPARCTIAPVA